jgi:hypothetical protein
MPFCSKCNKYSLYSSSHKCPPQWRCWNIDIYGEDIHGGHLFYGWDAGDAAREWAAWSDLDEHALLDGALEEVLIVREDDYKKVQDEENPESLLEVKKFSVYGEAQPVYYAREIEGKG